MPIKVQCPNCQAYLSAPEELVGQQARCINCDEVVTVPPPDEAGASDLGDAPTFAADRKRLVIVIAGAVAIVVIVAVLLKSFGVF